jgi:hypothetical protein
VAAGKINVEELLADNPIVDVVSRYVELKQSGHEYVGLCPFHAERTASFFVNPIKNVYLCRGCGEGGDTITFLREIEHVSFKEAAQMLGAKTFTSGGQPQQLPPLPALPKREVKQPPPNIPLPDFAATHYGIPTQTWCYTNALGEPLFYVARYDTSPGNKVTPQWTWGRRSEDDNFKWGMGHWPSPRPLYGLHRLAASPEATVVVVEGEGKCDAAQRMLPRYVAMAWSGGANAAGKTDWTPLAGKKVLIWPDADDVGRDAAQEIAIILTALGCKVRVVNVDDRSGGWDAADAEKEKWTLEQALAFLRERQGPPKPIETPKPVETKPEPPPIDIPFPGETSTQAVPDPEPTAPPSSKPNLSIVSATDDPYPTGEAMWQRIGLSLNAQRKPFPNIDNIVRIIEAHPLWEKKLSYDTFSRRTMWDGKPMRDEHAYELVIWMQRNANIPTITIGTVHEAAAAIGFRRAYNAPQEWLRKLPAYQKTESTIDRLLIKGFGTEDTEYNRMIGSNWMKSLVARIRTPGVKVDTMPVLEGKQGKMKSSSLEALASKDWFTVCHESIMSKDFFMSIQGVIIAEISEMDAFGRAQIERVKSVITTAVDKFRKPYGRVMEEFPRQVVFGGTCNTNDWGRDETGARRFWPVKTRQCSPAWIMEHRDLLFAEAAQRLDNGENWYDLSNPELAEAEQRARNERDPWERTVYEFCLDKEQNGVNVEDILLGPLQFIKASMEFKDAARVRRILRRMQWDNKPWTDLSGKTSRKWRPDTSED